MKKVISLFLAFVLCLGLCACGDSAAATAVRAFDEGNYQEVVSSLADREITDENVGALLTAAKAYLAYEARDYEQIVSLLSDFSFPEDENGQALSAMLREAEARLAYAKEDYAAAAELLDGLESEDEELQQMLTLSRAQLAYGEKKYDEVAALLAGVSDEAAAPLYADSLAQLARAAFDKRDRAALASLCAEHAAAAEPVYALVTEACAAFDYDAFLFLDKLIAKLPAGELKDRLKTFSDENGKMRTKAFLNGEWQWLYKEDEENPAIVALHVFEDDSHCIGFLTQVPDHLANYKYEINDVYWKDFVFEGDLPIACYNLTRMPWSGSVVEKTASIELDFEHMQIIIHLTGVDDTNRVWQKIG